MHLFLKYWQENMMYFCGFLLSYRASATSVSKLKYLLKQTLKIKPSKYCLCFFNYTQNPEYVKR